MNKSRAYEIILVSLSIDRVQDSR